MATLYEENLAAFRAAGDGSRMKILELLSRGELCACKILDLMELTQPTLSHHMKILCDSGLVTARKEGKWMHYRINDEKVDAMRELLDALLLPIGGQPVLPSETGGKIKLYVLTGFLGSGKTTILKKLLETLSGQRIGVIQNEFGKLGIDGTILRNDDIKMVEINRGSIFCSCLKLSFVEALSEMAKQDLQYLFVESSGLGDPSNVEEILQAVQLMAGDRYLFSGAVCLVDALNFLDQLDDLETVYRQLKHCHLAVITKVDLVDPQRLSLVKEKIREINPRCRIDLSSKGSLDLAFLNEDLMRYRWAEGEETTNTEETKPKTLTLNFEGEVQQEKLESFLNAISPDVYRVKGFFQMKEQGWRQVDLVGSQVEFQPCVKKEISQLVVISKIGPALIRKLFQLWEEIVGLKMELKN